MLKTREKLLFVYVYPSTFIMGDLEILRREYDVTIYHYDTRRNALYVVFRQFFWLMFNVWRFSKVYIWFGDYHAFFPVLFSRLFRKRSFLVVGGYDVCRIKKLKYGSFSNPLRGWITRYAMRHCTLNLCVSKHVERKLRIITRKQNSVLLYNGTAIQYEDVAAENKKDVILTVALVKKQNTFAIKGIDRFYALAKALPQYKFVLVGVAKEFFAQFEKHPDNLEICGEVKQDELVRYYQAAKVYCQLSRSEVFGLALVEGMLYNCVPVVTNVGGMPEVVGDTGYIVNERHLDLLPGIVEQAIHKDYSNCCRERIEKNFLLTVREKKLLEILRRN